MSSVVYFPSAESITMTIFSASVFKQPIYLNSLLTKTITELAIARFADKRLPEITVNNSISIMINDLKTERDSETEEDLPCFKALKDINWDEISIAIKDILYQSALIMDSESLVEN